MLNSRASVRVKSRLAGVDLIRLAALFAIVVGHAYPNSEWVDRFLQSWRLPIFFMLSGFFWSGNRTFRDEVYKRVHSLLIPYFLWGTAITVISILIFDYDIARTIKQFALGGSYAQRPFTAFWFLTALFVAACLFRILASLPPVITWLLSGAGLLLKVDTSKNCWRVVA